MGYPKHNVNTAKVYRYTKDALKNETIVSGFPITIECRIVDQASKVSLKGTLVEVAGFIETDNSYGIKESDTLEVDSSKRSIKGITYTRGLSGYISRIKVYYA
jgi:hypothetical protein